MDRLRPQQSLGMVRWAARRQQAEPQDTGAAGATLARSTPYSVELQTQSRRVLCQDRAWQFVSRWDDLLAHFGRVPVPGQAETKAGHGAAWLACVNEAAAGLERHHAKRPRRARADSALADRSRKGT